MHGGCVSSAGMMFTSFAGRRLGCEIVDLGFSGGGKMELQMADIIAETDASLYVVDCDWNMTVGMQKERYEPFVRRLRKLRPSVPILLCGGCTERKSPRDQEVFAKSVHDNGAPFMGEVYARRMGEILGSCGNRVPAGHVK